MRTVEVFCTNPECDELYEVKVEFGYHSTFHDPGEPSHVHDLGCPKCGQLLSDLGREKAVLKAEDEIIGDAERQADWYWEDRKDRVPDQPDTYDDLDQPKR